MYTHIFILWIKGCQLLRNFMCDATYNNSFDSVWTAVNEVSMHIV